MHQKIIKAWVSGNFTGMKSMVQDVRYCELCGALIRGPARRVSVEGVSMTVCTRCYSRLASRRRETPAKPAGPVRPPRPAAQRRRTRPRRDTLYDRYEVVEDYAERIRQARVRLGWSQAVLAQRVGEGENVIKRIEAGRLVPPIDLARRLEKVLRIRLLEPVVEEVFPASAGKHEDYTLTLGDIVRIRGEDE